MKIPLTRRLALRLSLCPTTRGAARIRSLRRLGMALQDIGMEFGLCTPEDCKTPHEGDADGCEHS
jgi:hypothetical protein